MYRHLSPNLQNGKWGHWLANLLGRVHEGAVLLLARRVVAAPHLGRVLALLLLRLLLAVLRRLFGVDDFGLDSLGVLAQLDPVEDGGLLAGRPVWLLSLREDAVGKGLLLGQTVDVAGQLLVEPVNDLGDQLVVALVSPLLSSPRSPSQRLPWWPCCRLS